MFLPRRDRMFRLSTSAGRSPLSAVSMPYTRDTESGVRFCPDLMSSSSSSNSRTAVALSAGRAGDGDLVAADVDVAVELALDDPQQLIARSEQRDHGLLTGHDERRGDAIRGQILFEQDVGLVSVQQSALSGRAGLWSSPPLYRRTAPRAAHFGPNRGGGPGSAGRPAHPPAGEHVGVDVEDALAGLRAGVEDRAEVAEPLLLGQPADRRPAAPPPPRRPRPRSAMSLKCSRGRPARAPAPAG